MSTEADSYVKQVIRGSYLPHVDGLRAVAVLAVVLYHLKNSLCPGGFAGVDVFFVISGYLIGGGVLRDLQRGTFSLAQFYTRRIKRIMPAYFAMIATTLLAGLCIYHYEPFASLGNAALRSAYFFANFFCYKYVGDYFAGDAEAHPLLNLWSLSVEEQFYLIIPCVLLLLWLICRRALLPVLLAACVASFVYAEYLLGSDTIRYHVKAFYMLAPRAWELLIGIVLAALPAAAAKRLPSVLFSTLGLLLIIGSYIWLAEASSFPGSGALASTLGACLLIRYGASGYMGSFLGSAPMTWVGRISYSLYLWHWPVIVFGRYVTEKNFGWEWMVGAVLLSFVLAYGSWRFIEMPVRRANVSFARAMAGLVICCALVAGVGSLLYKTNGLVNYIHQDANSYVSLEYPRKLTPVDTALTGIEQMEALDEKGNMQSSLICWLGDDKSQPEFVLIGDSHAEALQIGLDDVSRERGRAGLAVCLKTCPLSGIEITNTFSNLCEPFMDWLKKSPQVKTVLLMCRWETRLEPTSPQILYRAGEEVPTDGSQNLNYLREGLLETCRRIHEECGREVVLLGPVPALPFSPGTRVRERVMLGRSTEDLGDFVPEEEFLRSQSIAMELLRECESRGYARIVWLHPTLLHRGGFCGVRDGKLYYHDSNHLSGEGSRYVIGKVFEEIFPQLSPEKQP